MNYIVLLLCLFPIAFMLHDFEEIIVLPKWMARNANILRTRFPFLKKQIAQLQGLSMPGFVIAVAEEFIIISGVSVYAVLTQHYFLWMALFLAFGIHLLIHILQFIILKRYIPAIVTSFLCLPYAVYVCSVFYSEEIFTLIEFVFAGVVGLVAMVLNLQLAHVLGRKLDTLI